MKIKLKDKVKCKCPCNCGCLITQYCVDHFGGLCHYCGNSHPSLKEDVAEAKWLQAQRDNGGD